MIMPTTNTNASSLLAESLAALSRSAYQAFAEVESQAQQDVAQAISDLREARLERDRASETLNAAQAEGRSLQKEITGIKATLRQAELTIAHQKETVAQLRREATQWKDQSRNWQEHFLRVEQERCNLTTRIEELVAERLQWHQTLNIPFTSYRSALDIIDATPLPSTKRQASANSLTKPTVRSLSSPDVDSPSASHGAPKVKRSSTKPIKMQRQEDLLPRGVTSSRETNGVNRKSAQHIRPFRTSTSPHNVSRLKVIRRVHAVIGVKREESDDESRNLAGESNIELETIESGGKSKRPIPRKRKAVPDDDNFHIASGDESNYTPVTSDQSYEDNEDNDELMLGGEMNLDEHYSKSTISSKHTPPPTNGVTSPSKKRKVVGRDKPPTRRNP